MSWLAGIQQWIAQNALSQGVPVDPAAELRRQQAIAAANAAALAAMRAQQSPQTATSAGAPGAAQVPGLSAEEIAHFQAQRRNADMQYGHGLARNTFDMGQLDTQLTRGREDLKRQFDQLRNKIPGQMAGRGLLNSGIYKSKLSQYAQDRAQTAGRFEQDALAQRNRLQTDKGQLDDLWTAAKQDIASQETLRRQALAAQLRGLT